MRRIYRRPARSAGIDPAKLRAARVSAGMTLDQLAAQVGVSNSHVSGIEHGSHDAGPQTAAALARALSMPLADLLVAGTASPARRPLTYAERAQLAKADHSCPVCQARVGKRCLATSGPRTGKPMKGIHDGRVRLVPRT